MSLEDIRENYTTVLINGQEYKIAYDFNSIGKLLELHGCSFSNLYSAIVEKGQFGSLNELIDIMHIGFLKYQPSMEREVIEQYPYYLSLYTKCHLEFMRCVQEPDEWEQTVYANTKSGQAQPQASAKKKVGWISRIFGSKHVG